MLQSNQIEFLLLSRLLGSTDYSLIDIISREILSELCLQYSEYLLTDQNIYNLKKKLRRNRLDVYISTQTLLQVLYRDC